MVVARNKRGLSDEQYNDMLEMLTQLTPAERSMLKYPDFITEDEADIIVSDRRLASESTVSLDEVLKEAGIPRRQRV